MTEKKFQRLEEKFQKTEEAETLKMQEVEQEVEKEEEVEKEKEEEEEGGKSADPALVATEFKTVTLAGEKLIKDLKINRMMFFFTGLVWTRFDLEARTS